MEATGARAEFFEGIWGEALSLSLFQRRGNMSRLQVAVEKGRH